MTSIRFLFALIILLSSSAALLAQESGPERLMKAQFLELEGKLDEAKTELEAALQSEDAESRDVARLRLAAIHRLQGDEEALREILSPLITRSDALGATARKMLARGEAAVSSREMTPVLRLIAVLDEGDFAADQRVQSAMVSLRTLGALVVPTLIERFDTLGIFGRRNAVDFLMSFETDPGVRLLFEGMVREDRSGEAAFLLDWIRGRWEFKENLIRLAAWGLESRDEVARLESFRILAEQLARDDDPQLIARCRSIFADMLKRAIDEKGRGNHAELAEEFLGEEILGEVEGLETFLRLRAPLSLSGWATSVWFKSLTPEDDKEFDAVLAEADGSPYYELLQMNALHSQPFTTGLKAGLKYSVTAASCVEQCRRLGLEITMADWASIAASAHVDAETAALAFSKLGSEFHPDAVQQARVIVAKESTWFRSAMAAFAYLVRVAPERVIEELDPILNDEGRRQLLVELVTSEPSPSKARIAVAILRKGGHYDHRLLTTIAAGSSRAEIPAILALLRAPCTSLDADCIQDLSTALRLVFDRVAQVEDFPILFAEHDKIIARGRGALLPALERLVRPEHRDLIRARLQAVLARAQGSAGQAPAPSFGDEAWRTTTADRWDIGVRLISLLHQTGTEVRPEIQDIIFGSAHSWYRCAALEQVRHFDKADRIRIYRGVLDSGEYDLIGKMIDLPIVSVHDGLRQRAREVVLKAPRALNAGAFLAGLPLEERRETCVALLKSSPLLGDEKNGTDALAQDALAALGTIKDEELIPLFETFVGGNLTSSAINNLGNLYSRKVIPILIEALKLENPHAQSLARSWLEKLESHFSEQKRWQKLLEETQELEDAGEAESR